MPPAAVGAAERYALRGAGRAPAGAGAAVRGAGPARGGPVRSAARGSRLAQGRGALRILFRLTDRGERVAPGVLGCAYPRTERSLAALSESDVGLLVNLDEAAPDPDRL